MIRGLIFDFDGLILDTESTVYQSWQEIYREHNQDLPFDEWGEIIGVSPDEHFDPIERLETLVGQRLNRGEIKEKRLQRELGLLATQPILPGVENYLQNAQRLGLKLGIASSSSRKWVHGHLKRLGLLKYFQVMHTSDDVEHTKPDPALYRLALKSLDINAEEAIALEDSPNGVTAAQRAGLFCVAIPNPLTIQLCLDHADLRIDSLEDMAIETLIEKATIKRKAIPL
ncbi:MAG: HAD family hydrolase [Chloroflexota bacterium]|nr:HAD family hydrolase [Chloroflexota bacterium]